MRALLLAALLLAPHAARAENPVVRFTTTLGSFDAELCNEVSTVCTAAVPDSVANFLGYLDRGDYVGAVFHRSTTLASAGVVVIQSGGFRRVAPASIRPVPTQPPIENEPMQSNLRGTIAYARLTTPEDSATSQWFVNVVNNTVLNPSISSDGFTVFGVVLGDGMTVVDAISQLGRININAPYLDPLFGPNPIPIATNFTETPFIDEFYDLFVEIEDPEDLPPVLDFANAMIYTEVTRVPEPAGAVAGAAAALALTALAARRR